MHSQYTTYGGLNCHVFSATDEPPQTLAVLCHGYGASGRDLAPLAGALAKLTPVTSQVRFLLPEGPLSLASLGLASGRAWWHLDVAALQKRRFHSAKWLQELRQEAFPGLPQARRMLRSAIDLALQQAGLGYDALVLGGFSQGAMLTTDLALRLEEAPAGLAILSGTLTDEPSWTRLAARRQGLRVVQSHGRQDPILPYANAEALRDVLKGAGCDVTFLPFAGGHTIPEDALSAISSLF
jgi:phospholipase/carboxylesterase